MNLEETFYYLKNIILSEEGTVIKKREGLGFVVEIHSREHNPPHAHIIDMENQLIGIFEITVNPPASFNDIKSFRITVSNDVKKKIFQWSLKNKDNWKSLKIAWNAICPNLYHFTEKELNV
jgi:hypothetical protein